MSGDEDRLAVVLPDVINVLECQDGVWRLVLLNSTNHMGYLFSGIEQKGL